MKVCLKSIILFLISVLLLIILTTGQAAADLYSPSPLFKISGISHELLLAGVLTLMLVICAIAEIISIMKHSREKACDDSPDSDSKNTKGE
ncbi:MAG TPA: hypothetical protein PKW98_14365 [Candidatus Wallbacteria bacterium]|nr:MAG: hypothetical protein BWY32_02792 [bacterium ADurb.Bin243]HOD41585.1 hypothetical protein [Candidatus Wallbacteria bacterium]HPG59000.1 hypothetical protein [Candidatus Wallbacteria bacterium]